MGKFRSLIPLDEFKDQGNVEEVIKQVHIDLLDNLKRKENWELKNDLGSHENIILNYELNKPKGQSTLGKINYLLGGETRKYSKNPHLDVSIRLSYILEKHVLDKTIEIELSGTSLDKYSRNFDLLGSFKDKISGLTKKVDTHNSEINSIISEIVDKTLKVFEKKRINNNKKELKILNSEIEPIEFKSDIRNILMENQNMFTDEHIPKLLKIIEYYSNNLENYMGLYKLIQDKKFVEEHQYKVKETIEMIPTMYKSIILIETYVLEMFNSQVNGDRITYFTMYNIFEDLGLFMTKGEKLMIENTNKMIDGIGLVNSSINNLIETSIEIGNKISSQLQSVNRKLNINKLLTGINTYQLSKINKNTQ